MTRERFLEILDNCEMENYKNNPEFILEANKYKLERKVEEERLRQERKDKTISYIRDGKIDIILDIEE